MSRVSAARISGNTVPSRWGSSRVPYGAGTRTVVAGRHVRDAAWKEQPVQKVQQILGDIQRFEILAGRGGGQDDWNSTGAMRDRIDVFLADSMKRVRPDALDVRHDPDHRPAARSALHDAVPQHSLDEAKM